MRSIYKSIILISIILWCSGCNNIRKEKGYIVQFMPNVLNFIPVKSMQLDSSTTSFYSSNFKNGFQFSVENIFKDKIITSMDTIKYRDLYEGSYFNYKFIYIAPVEIEYKDISKDEHRYNIDEIHNYKMEIDGKEIIFFYSFRDYELVKISTLKTKFRKKMNSEDKILLQKQDSIIRSYRGF
jgi:hypothetical protein